MDEVNPILDKLKTIYKEKILPVEQDFNFPAFFSPSLTGTDIDAKPLVLLIGQYSTGKTSFIRYLLERDFPGCHIGPEPTTDRFVAVMHSHEERQIPGNALAADSDRPFTALNKFGMSFLNRFEASLCPSPILEKVTFVDTPGVLSGEKQRIGRSYDYPAIVEWFAERADRILLLFDANKLDISDEFKMAIESLKGHDEKIRVVLNKADMDTQRLMRVYGALMWSLGKVTQTPEVLRVYVGSFWENPLQFPENEKLIKAEMSDLVADLRSLPRNSAIRKVNEMMKRGKRAKVHMLIINHLRNQFGMFGKSKTQDKILTNLLDQFKAVQAEYKVVPGDFPHVARFKETLASFKINKFPKIDKKKFALMEEALTQDIPGLIKQLPGNAFASAPAAAPNAYAVNPFQVAEERKAVNASWAIDQGTKAKYDNIFHSSPLTQDGKMSGGTAKNVLLATGVNTSFLRKIWDLSDMDKDGALDVDEFSVAQWLCDQIKGGHLTHPPEALEPEQIPPNKRHLFETC
mmetsp:Transcript_16845/g.32878  ORF Transcript_16845/g.32878 Transcript_16845/m.32878 type:complete len:518 (-) Transcript_16845:196-1749(-)